MTGARVASFPTASDAGAMRSSLRPDEILHTEPVFPSARGGAACRHRAHPPACRRIVHHAFKKLLSEQRGQPCEQAKHLCRKTRYTCTVRATLSTFKPGEVNKIFLFIFISKIKAHVHVIVDLGL